MAKRIADRNPSTAKGYQRGQDAWKAWCRQHSWEDGELVRETKLPLFLKDVVVPLRTGGRERRSTRDRAESKRARNAATKRRSRKRKRDESNGKQAEEKEMVWKRRGRRMRLSRLREVPILYNLRLLLLILSV